jgi:hypothetical protein
MNRSVHTAAPRSRAYEDWQTKTLRRHEQVAVDRRPLFGVRRLDAALVRGGLMPIGEVDSGELPGRLLPRYRVASENR